MTIARNLLFLMISVVCSDLAAGFMERSLSQSFPSQLFVKEGNFEAEGESHEWKKARVPRMKQSFDTFLIGEELRNLRLDLESLRQNLQWAEALKDDTRIESLSKAIKDGESRDPDHMYQKALGIIEQTKKMKGVAEEEKECLVEKWGKIAATARQYVQEFNLDGKQTTFSVSAIAFRII